MYVQHNLTHTNFGVLQFLINCFKYGLKAPAQTHNSLESTQENFSLDEKEHSKGTERHKSTT